MFPVISKLPLPVTLPCISAEFAEIRPEDLTNEADTVQSKVVLSASTYISVPPIPAAKVSAATIFVVRNETYGAVLILISLNTTPP